MGFPPSFGTFSVGKAPLFQYVHLYMVEFFWIPGKKSSFCSFPQFSFRITYSHTVHVWYIYLHENHKQSTIHVGKYIYHGWMVWEIPIDKDCLHEIQVAKVDMLFLGFLFGQNSKKWAVVWQHSFFDIYFKIDFMCIFAYQSPPPKKKTRKSKQPNSHTKKSPKKTQQCQQVQV